MGRTSLLLAVVATLYVAGTVADIGSHLSLKFDVLGGYYDIGLTLAQLRKDVRWQLMVHDDELNVDFWCLKDDPRVSIGYDTYGNIAGVRVSYIKEDLPKRAEKNGKTYPFRFDNKPMFSSATYLGRDVWYNTVLFVHPSQLKKQGGRTFYYNSVGDDVYLKLNGQWTLIPKDECKAESLGFTEQGCFLGMGKHYFHGMTKATDCADLQGVFLLYEYGNLVGLGLIPFGSFSSSKDRTWFEDPPALVVNQIVPHGPKCLPKWITDYGSSSLHLFFKALPRTTLCIPPGQIPNRCRTKKGGLIPNPLGLLG